jgi:hypothetical protein
LAGGTSFLFAQAGIYQVHLSISSFSGGANGSFNLSINGLSSSAAWRITGTLISGDRLISVHTNDTATLNLQGTLESAFIDGTSFPCALIITQLSAGGS